MKLKLEKRKSKEYLVMIHTFIGDTKSDFEGE